MHTGSRLQVRVCFRGRDVGPHDGAEHSVRAECRARGARRAAGVDIVGVGDPRLILPGDEAAELEQAA